VIAGDDGAGLVAGGGSAGHLLDAVRRLHDELVRGQHHLGRQPRAGLGGRLTQQPLAALHFGGQGLGGLQCPDGLPRFGRGDQGGIFARRQIHAEVTGTPKRTMRIVAAGVLNAVHPLLDEPLLASEGRLLAVQQHPERRQVLARR
jgi:hypothetical protein